MPYYGAGGERCVESLIAVDVGESKRPVSSIKVEVKKKHLSNGWRFSCFAAHFIEQDLF
jgi:hypothetical protein